MYAFDAVEEDSDATRWRETPDADPDARAAADRRQSGAFRLRARRAVRQARLPLSDPELERAWVADLNPPMTRKQTTTRDV